jgi:hypothetical protein
LKRRAYRLKVQPIQDESREALTVRVLDVIAKLVAEKQSLVERGKLSSKAYEKWYAGEAWQHFYDCLAEFQGEEALRPCSDQQGCQWCEIAEWCGAWRTNYSMIPWSVIDLHLAGLSGSATKVLLFLSRHANFDHKNRKAFGRCSCTMGEIAQGTGLNRNYLRQSVRELEEHELVQSKTFARRRGAGAVQVHLFFLPHIVSHRSAREEAYEDKGT